jgi:signal transduction histidine kinase
MSGSRPASATTRQVVLLFGGRVESPALAALAADITRTLRDGAADPVEVNIENLDLSQSASASYKATLRDFLHEKYLDRKIDVALAVMKPALDFLLDYGDAIFPGTSIAFCGLDRTDVASRPLPSSVNGVFARREFASTLELALRLHPHTEKVVVISGTSNFDVALLAEARKEFGGFEKRVSFTYPSELSLKDQLVQLSRLPERTVVLFMTFFRDGAGAPFAPQDAVEQVSAAANRPVYGFTDQVLGHGIVGGSLFSFAELGAETGKLISRILAASEHTQLLVDVPRKLMFDWRQLQRWGIDENRLPRGSGIYFREPGAWEKNRWLFALVCAVMLLQGGLISGLLLERRRRIHYEVQASRRSAELAHANRVSMAGELTASIAHELNQPLGAILVNAETAGLLLKSSTPDLDELRDIIGDIRRDDLRASDVIQHLRDMLKKVPSETRNADLNEIVRDTIPLLTRLSTARQIRIDSTIVPAPLPIRADRVLLQQVMMNLGVNAMDALSGAPRAERTVTIATSRGADFALLSVSDTGPGIDIGKLKNVFEPFFTTKPNGMGMGLSIARTIVETHQGKIWAENRQGGGATFYVELPLVAQDA